MNPSCTNGFRVARDSSRVRALQAGTGFLCAFLTVVLAFTLSVNSAFAQHPSAGGAAPAPAAGNGTLTVQVTHATDASESAGIEIVLYALSPDGTPGLANGETNAKGLHQFANISTDPGIVYLIGARYAGIPFGQRITFAANETTARVEIEIMSPTAELTGVAIEELRLRIDWMGDRVLVREILRVKNPGEQVIRLSQDRTSGQDARAIFTRKLDRAASDFSSGPNGVDDGLVLEGGAVRFLGPLYPGEQSIEYRYSLPIPGDELSGGRKSFKLPVELASAAARVVVVAGTVGLGVEGSGLIASSPVQSDTGQSLEAWARSGLAAGENLELSLTLPESRPATGLLTIPRSDLWIEVDDAQLTATVDLQIEIAPGAPVAGTIESPLLQIVIPEGATLQGVAPEAEALGLIPIEGGGFDIVGPIGSGTTSLGYSYKIPVARGGVQLDMRFPAEVETLNVLIADTGLALDSSRLHRRRPFRSGTRNYLHRQAYNIEVGEVVDLELVPLTATGVSRNASIMLTIAAAAAGAFFMFSPLRAALRREAEELSPRAAIQEKREAVYTAIADLDHDFETAKLEEADYTPMRDRLRHEAIELLRAERATGTVRILPTDADAQTPSAPGQSATGGFCPSCGGAVTAAWRFCSHCGGHLNPPEEANA